MVTSSLWTDFDNDGWEDLIITGEYMPLTFIHNNKGVLEDVTAATGLKTPGDGGTVSLQAILIMMETWIISQAILASTPGLKLQ
ncbi:MAG: VCBS repeat-containing protein [Saprospiraceae bacterium]|nr:VCBS repeat-containing protein [Saprospiraceae bacterium]